MDDQALTNRALRAYFRSCPWADQPGGLSGVRSHTNGRDYVVLDGGRNGPCAVYRVQNDETLKRLRRWPADLE